ncbi:MAG: pilus assembly protein [Clostridiales bacterium]|nr:pilus assembly protein [Clostridiales bacterium]
MKKERAALTVEAALVLTLFMVFFLFLLSFNVVYSAQNMVSHATLQAADAISVESMLRTGSNNQGMGNMLTVSNHIYNGESVESSALEKLTNNNIAGIAKDDFIAAISDSETKADEILKKCHVKGGLEGIDFSGCKYNSDTGETIVYVKYAVELQFPLFGFREINMTKAAKVTNMGKDTCVVTVKAKDPTQGSTSGTVRVLRGHSTTIVAYPYYGYRFVRWIEDGSSTNPKEIIVDRDMTYTAVFEKAYYAVQADVNNPAYGTTTGSGSYKLNDVANLTAKTRVEGGYRFLGWDANGNGVVDADESTQSTLSFKVRRDVKVTAIFEPIPYDITVTTDGRGIASLSAGGNTVSTGLAANSTAKLTLNYGTQFTINAESGDYKFIKWTGSIERADAKQNLTVPVGGGTYKANFEEPYFAFTSESEYSIDEDGIKLLTSGGYTNDGKYINSQSDFFNCFNITTEKVLIIDTNLRSPITWTSSNPNIISVDSNGKITVKNVGTAIITASTKTADGEVFSKSKQVSARRLMVEANYQTRDGYRHYYSEPMRSWSGYNTIYGWFYRYQFVDSLSGLQTVAPGTETNGKMVHPLQGTSEIQNGTNKSNETGYVYFWKHDDTSMDIPMFDRGVKLWSIY